MPSSNTVLPPSPHFLRRRKSRQSRRSFATGRTILALMLREMSTQYGRNPGGYIWALLEPIGSIGMLAVGFSFVLHTPPLGNSFMLFYATGMTIFLLFQDVSNVTARALTFSRPLLSYPAVTWMDAILARVFLAMLTNMFVIFVLFTVIILVTNSYLLIAPGPIILAIALAGLLGMGVGCVNCVLGGLYPTWLTVWSIITRPLFIASGIIFLYTELPRDAQNILWYNPLIHITGLMRKGFYNPIYPADYASPLYVLVIALSMIAFGLLMIRRYHKHILSN